MGSELQNMAPMTERKVPGGKLVRVKTDLRDGVMVKVRIEGDFFVHPEEGVGMMESSLVGLRQDDHEGAKRALDKAVEDNDLILLGFSVNDIIELLGRDDAQR